MKRVSGDLGEGVYSASHQTSTRLRCCSFCASTFPTQARFSSPTARAHTEPMDDWNLARAAGLVRRALGPAGVRVVVVSPDETDGDSSRWSSVGLARCRTPSAGRRGSTSRRRASTSRPRSNGARGSASSPSIAVMGDGRNDVEMFRWAQAHGGEPWRWVRAPTSAPQAGCGIRALRRRRRRAPRALIARSGAAQARTGR